MVTVQRREALRVSSDYRTVSEPAVLVITVVTLIDLLAEERKRIHKTKQKLGKGGSRRCKNTHYIKMVKYVSRRNKRQMDSEANLKCEILTETKLWRGHLSSQSGLDRDQLKMLNNLLTLIVFCDYYLICY